MSGKFLIQADQANGLIRIIMAGFFSADDFKRFVVARDKAHAELGVAANAHLTLADVRRLKIQSPAMVEAFRLMLGDQQNHSRRLAFVTGATLVRSQLIRACADRDARCFDEPEEAEGWLLDTGDEQARRDAA